MNRDLPTSDDILEQLADKAAAQIDRLALVAFEAAIEEMLRYHRFLIASHAAVSNEGEKFSYGEAVTSFMRPPAHEVWNRQYRRLIDRAVDRMVDDSAFLRKLAYVPASLLAKLNAEDLSPRIAQGIIDIGLIVVFRLEAWFTKHSISNDDATEFRRLSLAGSDQNAFKRALVDVVGAWEDIQHFVPHLYEWKSAAKAPEDQWRGFCESWPFIWKHLEDTAQCLAYAVWNEDETGSAIFVDVLVQWTRNFDTQLRNRTELGNSILYFSTLLDLKWSDALVAIDAMLPAYLRDPNPHQVFKVILDQCHADVLTLTATLLHSWTINRKQQSDIGARTARRLLRREVQDKPDSAAERASFPSFGAMFLWMARLSLAGDRHSDKRYGAQLDGFVRHLDNMTERMVVPGRVYEPSTAHSADDLRYSTLSILLAIAPPNGDKGVAEALDLLISNDAALPMGDMSLRELSYDLNRLASTLEDAPREIFEAGFAMLNQQADFEKAFTKTLEVLRASVDQIENMRLKQLSSRKIDYTKLEKLRKETETQLKHTPPNIELFLGFDVGFSPDRVEGANVHGFRDAGLITKAQLVNPPMGSDPSGAPEIIATYISEQTGVLVAEAFRRKEPIRLDIPFRVEQEEFWSTLQSHLASAGPNPVLLISNRSDTRIWHRVLYGPPEKRPNLQTERRDVPWRGTGNYLITIQGVDVFSDSIPEGTARLFSARSLKSVCYAGWNDSGELVGFNFSVDNNGVSTLAVKYCLFVEWSDYPVFEIELPDPEEDFGVPN